MSSLDTSQPIVVASDPKKVQLAAAIRQGALAVGLIAGAFGAAGLSNHAHLVVQIADPIADLLVIAGPLVSAAAVWVGQMATRRHAQNAAAMAAQLPDRIAQTK